MAGTRISRLFSFVLLAACTASGQQSSLLPDAPSAQSANQSAPLRSLLDTPCRPVNTLATPNAGISHYDAGHFFYVLASRDTDASQLSFLASRGGIYHGSTNDTFLGRVGEAASGIVLTRDDDGNRRLNTPYLLRALTASVAHSAYRPYWRRSATQPVSDFGSTVGSDAGMNVFHEFEPGILHLVKNHEPRFVSKIEGHLSRR